MCFGSNLGFSQDEAMKTAHLKITLLLLCGALFAVGCSGGSLPKSPASVKSSPAPIVRVQISEANAIAVNGEAAPGKDLIVLDDALAKVDRGGLPRKETTVLVEASETAKCAYLSIALLALYEKGFEHFDLRIGESRFTLHFPRPALNSDDPGDDPQAPALRVAALADRNGDLKGIRLNEELLDGPEELRRSLTATIGDLPADAQPPVDLFASNELKVKHYATVLEAVSARTDSTGQRFPLAMNIWLFHLREGASIEEELDVERALDDSHPDGLPAAEIAPSVESKADPPD
jgi:biopolymer transport protein ExbD